MIMAIFALSLDLLVGHTGLVSLGHAAYFGLAAYVLALISPKYEAANLWLTLPAAIAAAAFAALVIGFLVVRTAGCLFHHGHPRLRADALFGFSRHQDWAAAPTGFTSTCGPSSPSPAIKPLDLENPVQFYYFVLLLLIVRIRVLEPGSARALRPRACRHRAQRSSACAPSAFRCFAYKLGAFVLAGALAGLAGYLAACQFGFVNPDILAWHQSGIVLMMVILGGMGRLHGAVLGALAYVFLQEFLSAPALLGAYAKHWQLAMGGLIVIIVLVLPHGIGGFIDAPSRRSHLPTDANGVAMDER